MKHQLRQQGSYVVPTQYPYNVSSHAKKTSIRRKLCDGELKGVGKMKDAVADV